MSNKRPFHVSGVAVHTDAVFCRLLRENSHSRVFRCGVSLLLADNGKHAHQRVYAGSVWRLRFGRSPARLRTF